MSKVSSVTFPNAVNDFYKTNGTVHLVMPGGPSLTRQEFAEECDINAIMKRYETVGGGPGGLPRHSDMPPFYADFSTMPTNLLEYMQLMQDAESAFMMLPATVRRTMDNDPLQFVDFASNPDNLEQMREWGLAPPKAAPIAAAGDAPGVPPPAAAAAPGSPQGLPGAPSPARPLASPASSTHGST